MNRVIPELDGVRGVAILAVLAYHFSLPPGMPHVLSNALGLGWSGVDLFFVLSGFLITGILMDTRTSGNYFSSFYARRVLRIFPLYLSFVFAYFVIALPLAHHLGYWQSWDNSMQPWYWLHLSNWLSAFGHDAVLLTHLWSLSIEEQFYLVWPIVVLFIRPAWLPYLCSILIIIPFALRLAYLNNSYGEEFLYRLTPFRVDTLAAGCLMAVIANNAAWCAAIGARLRYLTPAALSLLLFVLVWAHSESAYTPWMVTWGYTSLALIYACLVFSASFYSGSSHWWAIQLRRPFLRTFGKYSYGIYVLHIPILYFQSRFLFNISDRIPEGARAAVWILSIPVGVLLSFAAAQASWHLLEKHCLQWKKYFVAKPGLTLPRHHQKLLPKERPDNRHREV
jgi:peptidoglycan/LPS O-acetylase OafA/YrhL